MKPQRRILATLYAMRYIAAHTLKNQFIVSCINQDIELIESLSNKLFKTGKDIRTMSAVCKYWTHNIKHELKRM